MTLWVFQASNLLNTAFLSKKTQFLNKYQYRDNLRDWHARPTENIQIFIWVQPRLERGPTPDANLIRRCSNCQKFCPFFSPRPLRGQGQGEG